ncbi:MAG TPA: hypothetical protein VIM10_08485 [Actinopolymorphaceae bacterium]|jgi:hypothetical protein
MKTMKVIDEGPAAGTVASASRQSTTSTATRYRNRTQDAVLPQPGPL